MGKNKKKNSNVTDMDSKGRMDDCSGCSSDSKQPKMENKAKQNKKNEMK